MLRRSALYNTLLNNASPSAARTFREPTPELDDQFIDQLVDHISTPQDDGPRVLELGRWYHLIILAWLYTARLSHADYSVPRSFFHHVNIYHTAEEDHNLPELKKAVTEVLSLYQANVSGDDNEYDIPQFIFLVYGYRGGLDRQLRRRMVEPHIEYYVEGLRAWTTEDRDITAASVEDIAKMAADMIVWQGQRSLLGGHVRRLLTVGELALIRDEPLDVAQTAERMEEMAID